MNILNIILAIVTIASGSLSIYLYLENRKLKGFEAERDIKIKEAEREEIVNNYKEEREAKMQEMAGRMLTRSGIADMAYKRIDDKYDNKLKKIDVELAHLRRLRNHKSLFSKSKKVSEIDIYTKID